jgi:hypothetical protein
MRNGFDVTDAMGESIALCNPKQNGKETEKAL